MMTDLPKHDCSDPRCDTDSLDALHAAYVGHGRRGEDRCARSREGHRRWVARYRAQKATNIKENSK